MKIKKIVAFMLSTLMTVSALASCGVKNETPEKIEKDKVHYNIGIVQIMDHASLNTIRDAVVSQLNELGFKDGDNCTIDLQQANNEPTTVQQILDKFMSDEDDIIVAITTPCAQAAATYSEKVPVVFSAVTDPVAAGVAESLKKPGGNITGTSDKLAISKILDFAQELKPEIKKLGYLYNTGEDNSVSSLKEVRQYCEEKGIQVVSAAASNTSEVQEAAQKLASECDAVFSPNDNTIAGAMGTVTEVMNKAKVPMFVGADSMVKDGGLATVGIEYSDLGKETANMVASILKGEKKAGEIPVKVFNKDLSNYINTTTAKTIGIKIPDEIKKDKKTTLFD